MSKLKVGDWHVNPSENSITFEKDTIFIEPKAMDLLLLLVRANGETLARNDIIETIWERKFVNDSALNNLISTLRRYLNQNRLNQNSEDEAYIRTRPKRGYQLIAKVEYLDSSDSLPPQHVKQHSNHHSNLLDTENDPMRAKGSNSKRFLVFVVAGLACLVALLVFTIEDRNHQSIAITPETPSQTLKETPSNTQFSIAVLPFVLLDEEGDYEFFAEGLATELIHQLNVLPNFKVLSRRASFMFKDKQIDITEIGQTLDVDYLVEGALREIDGVVRVTVQLVSTKDGSIVWSQAFSAGRHNNFAIQHNISNEIASTLDASITQIPSEKLLYQPRSSEAYLHVLRGRKLNQLGTAEAHLLARDEFLMAVSLEPDYAMAHVDLAIAYLLLQQQKRLSADEANTLATQAIDKALAADLNLPEAHSAIGILQTNSAQYDKAENSFEKALSINPNLYVALINYANLMRLNYETEKAHILYQRALELHPLSSAASWGVSSSLIGLGRLNDAVIQANKCANRSPNSVSCYYIMAYAARLSNQHKIADQALTKATSLVSPNDFTHLTITAWHALWTNELQKGDAVFESHIKEYGLNITGLQTLSYIHFGLDKAPELLALFKAVDNPKDSTLPIIANYGHAAFFNLQWSTAADLYEHLVAKQPSLLNDRDIQANGVSYAANMAYSYQQMGDIEKAGEMIEVLEHAILDFPEGTQFIPGTTFLQMQYHILRGENEQAIALAEQLKASEWALLWLLDKDPISKQLSN